MSLILQGNTSHEIFDSMRKYNMLFNVYTYSTHWHREKISKTPDAFTRQFSTVNCVP